METHPKNTGFGGLSRRRCLAIWNSAAWRASKGGKSENSIAWEAVTAGKSENSLAWEAPTGEKSENSLAWGAPTGGGKWKFLAWEAPTGEKWKFPRLGSPHAGEKRKFPSLGSLHGGEKWKFSPGKPLLLQKHCQKQCLGRIYCLYGKKRVNYRLFDWKHWKNTVKNNVLEGCLIYMLELATGIGTWKNWRKHCK